MGAPLAFPEMAAYPMAKFGPTSWTVVEVCACPDVFVELQPVSNTANPTTISLIALGRYGNTSSSRSVAVGSGPTGEHQQSLGNRRIVFHLGAGVGEDTEGLRPFGDRQ